MKLTKLIGGALVSTILLSGAGVSFADEHEVTDQLGETTTIVTITDDADPVDPIDPTEPDNPNPIDPEQSHLTLEHVPTNYNFTSVVSNRSYSITSGAIEEGTIEVFNDRSSRDWVVKASVEEDKLIMGDSEFAVTNFKINGVELATGSQTVIAQNPSNTEENTGLISTDVNSVAIDFDDLENTLKAGDVLEGTINYQLYLVTSAD